jgi:hypothetical protein
MDSMDFEQMRDEVEELASESIFFMQELKRAEENVKFFQKELAKRKGKITFLTDDDGEGINCDAVRCLARKIPQSLPSLISNSRKQRKLLCEKLEILEQAQKIQKGKIDKHDMKIKIYIEVLHE